LYYDFDRFARLQSLAGICRSWLEQLLNRKAAGGSMSDDYKYRAFLSYSRADSKQAAKLHKALDSYRVPKSLQGMAGRRGPVPKSLHPIFRDREDLAGGGELGSSLLEALENSGALVVLCTPSSAGSHWVNEEIRFFQKTGRQEDIFPIIGSGDPDSDDPDIQCMPPALRDTSLLAADLREENLGNGHIVGDGPYIGRMKLIAGLLGMDLDQIRRREDTRRKRQMAALGVAAFLFLGLAGLAAVLGISAQRNADSANQQKLIAEQNEKRAIKGERLAEDKVRAEARARKRELKQRRIAEKNAVEAEQQRQQAERNSAEAQRQRQQAERSFAEAQRQTGIAQANAKRALIQFNRAQYAIAEAFTQRGFAAFEDGNSGLAIKLALAGRQISPESEPLQRVLLTSALAEPEQLADIEVASNQISFLAISPDGSRIMTSGLDRIARLFDTRSSQQISLSGDRAAAVKGLVGHRGRTGATRGGNANRRIGGTKLANNWFSPNNKHFLISLSDGSIEVRNTRTGRVEGSKLCCHKNLVLSAGFSPDGKRILTSSTDNTVGIWRFQTRQEEPSGRLLVPGLRSAAWSSDGEDIVTMSIRRGLEIWRDGKPTSRVPLSRDNLGALAITADGRQAIQIDERGTIRLMEIETGNLEVTLAGENVSRGAFIISTDSRFAVTGQNDGVVRIWDINSRQLLSRFKPYGDRVTALGISPDNNILATAGTDGRVKLWQLNSLFQPFRELVEKICTSEDGNSMWVFSKDEVASDPLIKAAWQGSNLCPFSQ